MLEVDFQTLVLDFDESYPDSLRGAEVAEYIAQSKVRSFVFQSENDWVITADTIVSLDEKILEKPKNESQAKEMLTSLSGRAHKVVSAFTMASQTKQITQSDETKVQMKTFSEAEIDHYIKNYQPFDKAGSYGIQEWIGVIGVEKIEGSYYTVMGLPIHKLYQALVDF